jgi:hypothetical protein
VAGTNTDICCVLEYCDMPPFVLIIFSRNDIYSNAMTAKCGSETFGTKILMAAYKKLQGLAGQKA